VKGLTASSKDAVRLLVDTKAQLKRA
jgi:hypothetical protein